MEFSILGPLEVRADGRAVSLGGAKPRGGAGVALLHADEPVSAERLALALWGEEAPPSAVKTVQVHVSRLRKRSAPTRAAHDARRLPAAGRRRRARRSSASSGSSRTGAERLAEDAPEQAAAVLREALALWRGPPLADLAVAAVRRRRDRALGGAAARGRRAARRGRPRRRAPRRAGRRAPAAHAASIRGASAARAADARAVSQRPPGRRAGGLPGTRARCSSSELGIEPGAELAELHAGDPRPRSRARRAAGDRRLPLAARLPAPPNRTIGREPSSPAIAERLRRASCGC